MQDHQGLFLVVEGSDGSGKTTQFRLLTERLKAVGHEVEIFKFPQHGESSSYFVNSYLSGEYGPATQVSPYTASLFYALDRYHASSKIRKALSSGKVVIADRYAGSNMAHQGSKFTNVAEQRGFFIWEDSLEFELLGIPRPNLNIYLRVPAEISAELMGNRQRRDYTDKKLDQHEADLGYLRKTVATYDLLCKLFPKDFKEIDCTQSGRLLSIVEINDRIWQTIKPLLPDPKRKGKAIVLNLDQPINASNSKTQLNSSTSDHKPASKMKQSKKESDLWLESILYLQKQMLAESASVKGINQLQLKKTISLVTPLLRLKLELKELLKEKAAIKSSADDEPVPVNEIIEQLAGSIPAAASDEQIKLLAANPRNEFQLLNEATSTGLNYQQKEQALATVLKNAASSVNYHFEATSDWATLLAFKNAISARQIEISAATPILGYAVPEIMEAAGLEEPFNRAFDLSAERYNRMTADNDKDAIYVLLLGHNVRWKFEVDASTLSKALKTSKNQELLSFLDLLRDKIAENHPHVARVLTDKEFAMVRKANKKRR